MPSNLGWTNLPTYQIHIQFIPLSKSTTRKSATAILQTHTLHLNCTLHFKHAPLQHFNNLHHHSDTMSSTANMSPLFATLSPELKHLIQQTAYLCDDEKIYQLLCACEGDNDLDLENPVELGPVEQSAILNAKTERQGQMDVDIGYVMTILSVYEDDENMEDLDNGEDMEDLSDEDDMEDPSDNEGYTVICRCEGCEKYYKNEAEAEAKAKAEAGAEAKAAGH